MGVKAIAKDQTGGILLLADQPFQLLLMGEVAKNLKLQGQSVSILLTDLYTFIYGPDLIEKVSDEVGLPVLNFQSNFQSWQSKGEPRDEKWQQAERILLKYSNIKSCGRDLETIRKTDSHTNGFEFSSWYLEISKKWSDVAHAEIMARCEEILGHVRPRLIVSIDNCQFATNVIHAMSRGKSQFITFQNSRIGTRWIARFNLAYGSHKLESPFVLQNETTLENQIKAQNLIDSYFSSGDPIYASPGLELVSDFRFGQKKLRSKSIENILREIRFLSLHVPRSVITGPRTRKIRVRRFDQNHLKIQRFELKRRLKNFVIDKGEEISNFNTSNYFFYALHYRPEGSGLVLGHGEDEILRIVETCKILEGLNQMLVIKEHPLMYGTRDKKDLKVLSQITNLKFAKRFSNSREWVRKSLGVIGISGTVLLEAAILKKPSFAFGAPEFIETIYSHSDLDLETFVSRCVAGSLPSKERELLDYISLVIANSTDSDTPLNPLQSWEKMGSDVNRMSKILINLVEKGSDGYTNY